VNRYEVGLLLTKCAAYDRRTIGEADIEAWHDALGDLPFDDASAAVTELYKTRPGRDWVGVSDVRSGVRRIRTARLAHANAAPPPAVDPDDVPAYLDAYREQRRLIADGGPVPVVPELPARPVTSLLRRVGRRVPPTPTEGDTAS
jgi:hypothetical protein